ncbi:Hypothetical protein MUW33_2861B [Mycobacterium canetti]|nr:Hypothetical protein MUW33_2861B [Mycobacterium canetti]
MAEKHRAMTPTIGKYRDEQSVKRPQYLLQYCWKRWQDRVRASGRPHRCRFARHTREGLQGR